MGFLRFLGKGKSKVKEELDIPPIPPPPADFSEGLEPIEELPPLPEIEENPEEIAKLGPIEAELPPLPGVGEEPEQVAEPELTDELPPLPEDQLMSEQPETEPSSGETASSVIEEEIPIAPLIKPQIPGHVKSGRTKKTEPLFVRMDSFRSNILGNLTLIKNEVKNSNEVLSKLNKLEQDENVLFKDWHSKMEDLQRKLMSIDKILFKG